MSSILITLTIFFLMFIFQLVILRILRFFNIHVFSSFLVYIIGFVILLYKHDFIADFYYSSLLIYILFTLLLITFSFVPLLGLKSPSSVIMTIVQTNGEVTLTQLQKAFDERQLILDRLNDLYDIGLVKKRKNRYIISSQGLFISKIIEIFRVAMGIKNQG